MKRRLSDVVILPLVAGLILAADQLSKHWVLAGLVEGASWEIAPWLTPVVQFTHVTNTGAAFGLFPGLSIVFLAVNIVVSVAIVVYGQQIPSGLRLPRVALGMQLGGALGNLVDRLTLGSVVDFIDVQFWPFRTFPIFNVADSSIVVGVTMLFLVMVWEERRERVQVGTSESS
ncbi:MAG: signal peptidase II [Anaerolineae bacterium]|nr:signal peptidase II [Anaerolineae bacterium]